MNIQQRRANTFQTLMKERDEARARADQLLAGIKTLRSKFPLNGSTAQELDAIITGEKQELCKN